MPKGRTLIKSGATFVVLALLTHFGITTERQRLEANLRTEVAREALSHLARLEAELNANVFLANGMVAHILAEGGSINKNVNRALAALQQHGRHIRNIGIAPGNRISHVYPLPGNEAAIGLYYPDQPDQWPAVKRAMDSGATVLAGPVALRQGGSGLISRTPVFLPDGRYWGLVSMVLDAQSLLTEAGLSSRAGEVALALRGRDGNGEQGEVFLGEPALFEGDSLRLNVTVPGGAWVLAARPAKGWQVDDGRLLALEAVGLLLSLLAALVVHGYVRGRGRLLASEMRSRAFLNTTRDAVIVIDDRGMMLEFNPAAERMFGYGMDEMVGQSVNQLMPPAEAARHDQYVAATRNHDTHQMAKGRQVVGVRRSGETFPIEVTVGETLLNGKRLHVGVLRDITERKAFEQRLIELATTDSLTGALNRRAFLEGAGDAFALAKRHNRPLSLLMVDADHFKRINDGHGHPAGDSVLVELVRLVASCLRGTDKLGRMGGEEFAVLLPETDYDHAAEVAERILDSIRQGRVAVGGDAVVNFTVSIGIATRHGEGDDLHALIRRADGALYQAKKNGRNRWVGGEAGQDAGTA